jgi:hypothetical protein
MLNQQIASKKGYVALLLAHRSHILVLLIVVILFAVILNCLYTMAQCKKENAAINSILCSGTIPTSDYWQTKPFPNNWLTRWVLWHILGKEHRITISVGLMYDNNDRDLRPLADLPYLETVSLCGSVTDTATQPLAQVVRLREVKLVSILLTDATLSHLEKCPLLEQLNVARTSVTGVGLSQFLRIHQLNELTINATQLADGGNELCQKLVKLKILWLRDGGIEKRHVSCLQQLPHGCSIYRVYGANIQDDATAVVEIKRIRPDLVLKLSVSVAGVESSRSNRSNPDRVAPERIPGTRQSGTDKR